MANNQLLASDNFTSGSLATGWSSFGAGGFGTVVSGSPNVVEPTAGTSRCGQIWTGISFPNDQISEVTVNSLINESGTGLGLWVRAGSGTGYIANFAAGSVGVSKNFGTSICSASVTLSAGDVVALSVAGSCLSVYHNGARVCYGFDTTLPSGGSPGFDEISATASHAQVSAWRGYSFVQQDGVWTKQGIIISASSTDLPFGAANPSQPIFEGNAQILSGNVYKMWFTSWSASGIAYAESSDGKNWTRAGSLVITGAIDPSVLKVGLTYFLYARVTATSEIAVWSSTNGISWTQQATNITGGTAFYFNAFTVQNGTWYAISAGGNLWTSPNGITGWTNAGQVITSGNVTAGAIVEINGVWYAWTQQNPNGQSDGTQCVRWKSSSIIPTSWSKDCQSAHISNMTEAINTFNGQCIPGSIVQVGNQTFFYCTEAPGDNTTPAIYQIGLLTAPAPLSSLVLFPEDAVSQVASDAFTGTLSNWTTLSGASPLQIPVSGLVEPTAVNASCVEMYTGAIFSPNQYSQITISALTSSGAFALPIVRASSPFNFYAANIAGPTGSTSSVFIERRGAGNIQVGPAISVSLAVGDVFRLQVINGSDGFPVLTLFQNGFVILQVQDYSNQLSSGAPGIFMFVNTGGAVTNAQINAWSGGNANVIPNYPGLYSWLGVDLNNSHCGVRH